MQKGRDYETEKFTKLDSSAEVFLVPSSARAGRAVSAIAAWLSAQSMFQKLTVGLVFPECFHVLSDRRDAQQYTIKVPSHIWTLYGDLYVCCSRGPAVAATFPCTPAPTTELIPSVLRSAGFGANRLQTGTACTVEHQANSGDGCMLAACRAGAITHRAMRKKYSREIYVASSTST